MDFPREEHEQRATRTIKTVESSAIDVLLAFGNKSHPGHLLYLSGYEPERSGAEESPLRRDSSARALRVTNFKITVAKH